MYCRDLAKLATSNKSKSNGICLSPPVLQITSVLRAEGSVVGAVAALLAEVDVGSDAALQQRLGGPGVVAHTHEDLVRLVLAEEAQGVHLWRIRW